MEMRLWNRWDRFIFASEHVEVDGRCRCCIAIRRRRLLPQADVIFFFDGRAHCVLRDSIEDSCPASEPNNTMQNCGISLCTLHLWTIYWQLTETTWRSVDRNIGCRCCICQWCMLGVREYQAVASVAKMHPLQYRMKVQWKGEKGEVKPSHNDGTRTPTPTPNWLFSLR